MATPRFATVSAVEAFGSDTRLITLAPQEPLPFVGGQYIIVDSGLVAPSGKAVKRAYSLLGRDDDPDELVIASLRLPGGLGSGYLHELRVGDPVKFSGPWGKLLPPAPPIERTLVLATDTGITAALGLVRGQSFAPWRAHTRFVWLHAQDFLPEDFVRSQLPGDLASCTIGPLPPQGHPERLSAVRTVLGADLEPGRLARVFITGDGAVNYALLDHFVAAGVPATRDNVDSFFNYPPKSGGTSAAA